MALLVAGTLWSATDAPGVWHDGPPHWSKPGTLRQPGARSLSSFIRNGDSGQTDPRLPSLTGLGEKDYGVDLPVAAYVTVPRSLARRAMIRSPPILRTIGTVKRGITLAAAPGEPREKPRRIRARLRSGDPAFRSTKPVWSAGIQNVVQGSVEHFGSAHLAAEFLEPSEIQDAEVGSNAVKQQTCLPRRRSFSPSARRIERCSIGKNRIPSR